MQAEGLLHTVRKLLTCGCGAGVFACGSFGWGGSPDPRPTPWSAFVLSRKARPGGPARTGASAHISYRNCESGLGAAFLTEYVSELLKRPTKMHRYEPTGGRSCDRSCGEAVGKLTVDDADQRGADFRV